MTARGTLLLVTVLVGLAGYLWMAGIGRQVERRAAASVEPAPLLAAPPTAVARVELEEGAHRLVAVRRVGGWTDLDGRRWGGEAVWDLLESLGSLRPVMTVDPDPDEPADYGFGADATRLRLLARDGRPLLALEVGERNPAWTGLYARRIGSREVLLVGALLRWELEKLQAHAPEP
jgi:hypothetical protein